MGGDKKVDGRTLKKTERNPNGTFKRKFFVPWDGSNWDDGFLGVHGYFRVYRPDHPLANHLGMARRHHVVLWLATGEVIQPGEALHHKNMVKTDDQLENLEKMSHADHSRLHSTKPLVDCICKVCGRHFGLPKWRVDQGRGDLCSQACYHHDRTGVNHPNARLTAEQVTYIRESREPASILMKKLGVGRGVVYGVREGRTYAA